MRLDFEQNINEKYSEKLWEKLKFLSKSMPQHRFLIGVDAVDLLSAKNVLQVSNMIFNKPKVKFYSVT